MVTRTQPSGPLCLWQCFTCTRQSCFAYLLKLLHVFFNVNVQYVHTINLTDPLQFPMINIYVERYLNTRNEMGGLMGQAHMSDIFYLYYFHCTQSHNLQNYLKLCVSSD